MNYITQIIEQKGLSQVAKACGVSYQAVRKWEIAGRLPRTEYTGETKHAEKLASLVEGEITKEQLLEMINAA